jgi:hypothetical protein
LRNTWGIGAFHHLQPLAVEARQVRHQPSALASSSSMGAALSTRRRLKRNWRSPNSRRAHSR